MCQKELTQIDGFETIAGQEAHSRSKREKGPRFDPLYPKELLDAYDNFILMCQEHHTLIDNNVEVFPTAAVETLKRRHEDRVARALDKKPKGWVNEPEMELVRNGTQLMQYISGCGARVLTSDHPTTEEETNAIATLFQQIEDWMDIADEIGSGGRVQAGASLQEELDVLAGLGWLTYAGVEDYRYQPDFVFPTLKLHAAKVLNDDSAE
jgi:hypothetical protein